MLNPITSETTLSRYVVYNRFVMFICRDFTPALFRFDKYVDVILYQLFAAAATFGIISYIGY